MVTRFVVTAMEWSVLLAQQKDPVIERLDPPRRAAVIMALLALVLTGLFLVMFVMVGAHWVRRLARHKPRNGDDSAAEAAAANERLRDSLRSVLPEVKTEDTINLGKAPRDTKLDS
jgi:hypothetical protein